MKVKTTCVAVMILAAGQSLFTQDWKPPVDLVYRDGDGIYMLMYGTSREEPMFTSKMNAALSLPYIQGIAYYQQWNELEPEMQGQFEWRQLDNAFDAVKQHGKKIILGMQAGVMSPQWLIEHPDVETIDFVHGNPGWSAWSTVHWTETVGTNSYTVSRMPLPWDEVYNAALESALSRIAVRFGDESCIEFVNVCGPSVSAGVEANFNVNWAASRALDPDFDAHLGYTAAKYINAWKRSTDAHLQIFTNAVLGIGLHSATGSQGFENGSVVTYSADDQMTAARAIRDYFLQQHTALRGEWGHVRNCGLSDSENLWGDPDSIDDKPASDFTALQWEVRDSAFAGYESGSVSSINGSGGVPRTVEEFETLIHNGITGYGRHLEIKVPDIVNNPYPHTPYEPYRPVLEEAARILSNSRIDMAAINAAAAGNVDWNSVIWGDPADVPISGNHYIHDGSVSAALLGLGAYGLFVGDSLRLDSGGILYGKGSGDLGTLQLNGGRWDVRVGGMSIVTGAVDIVEHATVLLVDGGMQLDGMISALPDTTLTIQNWKTECCLIMNAADDGFDGTFLVKDSGLEAIPWTVRFDQSYSNAALNVAGQQNDAAYAAVYELAGDVVFRSVRMPDGAGGSIDLEPGVYDAAALEAAGVSPDYFRDSGGTVRTGTQAFTAWAGEWDEAIGGLSDDADGDGLPNLYEYALGGDPTDPADRGIPLSCTLREGLLETVHAKRSDDDTLRYGLEGRSNLLSGAWYPMEYNIIGTNRTGEAYDDVTNSVSVSQPQLFIRLNVEQL
jgi:hypothetical protein